MNFTVRLTLLVFAALVLAGCGTGTSLTEPTERATAVDQAPATEEVRLLAEWEALLTYPGIAGVDYDPTQLTLSYLPKAQLPAHLASADLPATQRAAAQPNAVLRKNREYEPLTDALAARYGLSIGQQVYVRDQNLATFKLPPGADGNAIIEAIRRDFAGVVEYVTYSRYLRPAFVPNDPDYLSSTASTGPQWGHRRIGCSLAWDFTLGNSTVRIGVADTGVRLTHEELTGRVLDPEVEWPGSTFDLANLDNTIEDYSGHGTFIAGLIAAQGDNNRTIAGVAYSCQVVPVKISNGGLASDGNIIAGCNLAADPSVGCQVVNLSWGDYHTNYFLQQMVNNLHSAGVLFVAAAGNDDTTDAHYPSDYQKAFSVGSTNQSDGKASFSNYGSGVDIVAPGVSLKSSSKDNDSDYTTSQGTSYSSPIVAAAAALIWSYAPELTNDEVRALLETTGAEPTGFSDGVLRLDIAAAMNEIGLVRITPPLIDRLVYGGTITLTPEIRGEPELIELWLNDELVDSKTSGPWNFELDTSGIDFGPATIEFVGYQGEDQVSAMLKLIVDNTYGTFPVVDDFEQGARSFLGLDVRQGDETLIEALKALPDSSWSLEDIWGGGPAAWALDTGSEAYDGLRYERFGSGGDTYGSYELDALVSRRINLVGVPSPTLVFWHHYNIEDGGSDYDKGWVYVSEDEGRTFAAAELHGGGEAYFSGYEDSWTRAEVDLSAFTGKQVHLVLAVETDTFKAGEEDSEPAGWFVDNVAVAVDYLEDVPTIGGVNVAPHSVFGLIPGITQFEITASDPKDVDRMRFILDCKPLGTIDSKDVVVDVPSEPFTATLELPTPSADNQLAQLKVQYFDVDNVPGPELFIPVYLFNLLGDTDANGVVVEADLLAYDGKIGLTSNDDGYTPFLDSNLDGIITESDAAAVGYHWGEAL